MSGEQDFSAEVIRCVSPDCTATIKNHRWGKTRSGWFFSKEGWAACPNHLPDWVAAWRAKRVTS